MKLLAHYRCGNNHNILLQFTDYRVLGEEYDCEVCKKTMVLNKITEVADKEDITIQEGWKLLRGSDIKQVEEIDEEVGGVLRKGRIRHSNR